MRPPKRLRARISSQAQGRTPTHSPALAARLGACTSSVRSRESRSMRQRVRKWVLLHAICLSAAGAWEIAGQVGCSSARMDAPSNDPGAATTADSASIGMELTLPNGEQVNSLNWTVTGPNGAPTVVKTGTVSVGDSSTVQFVITGMPAGSNYVILLSGTSVD